MEAIIVDGYSKDNTMQILQSALQKAQLTYSVFYEKAGLGVARQLVVSNAKGKYIVWVDGDMILSKGFVKDQVVYMENHPDVGIAKGKYGSMPGKLNTTIVETLENVEFMIMTCKAETNTSSVLGTSGCIYRTKAIQEIGGFDLKITGVGEDMDAENRVHNAGWALSITSALFYETRRQSWSALWCEYFWHGLGGSQLSKKGRVVSIYKTLPPVAIALEFVRIPLAYQLIHKKRVVFLPVHYAFKRFAWLFGFVKGHFIK
jgi:glycosyltransferase involved in cell wall biosynthesis